MGHFQDRDFYFPQRHSSFVPAYTQFHFQGLRKAHSCNEGNDNSINHPECKENLVHLLKVLKIIVNSTAGGETFNDKN